MLVEWDQGDMKLVGNLWNVLEGAVELWRKTARQGEERREMGCNVT